MTAEDLDAVLRSDLAGYTAKARARLTPLALRQAADLAERLHAVADTLLSEQVRRARKVDDLSWAEIGEQLAMTRQAAHQRYRTAAGE